MVIHKNIIANETTTKLIDENINFINNVKLINGWLSIYDMCCISALLKIQNYNKIFGNLCEIGIFEGKSLAVLLNNCKNNEIVHGIDTFALLAKTYKTDDECFEKIKNNLSFLNNKFKNLNIIKGSSDKIPQYNINDIRFFHIDGYHSENNTYNDILIAYKIINEYGIIVLDDFAPCYIGVINAIFKLIYVNKLNLIPFLLTDSKLYLCILDKYNFYYNEFKNNIQCIIPKTYNVRLFNQYINANPILYLTYDMSICNDGPDIRDLIYEQC